MTIFIPYKIYLKQILILATFYKWKMQKSLFRNFVKKWFLHFSLMTSCLDQKMLKINLVGNKNRHSFCIYDEPQKWCLDPFSKNGYFWIFLPFLQSDISPFYHINFVYECFWCHIDVLWWRSRKITHLNPLEVCHSRRNVDSPIFT